jgi:hypothetical protein
MKEPIREAVDRLDKWITDSNWAGYDPFDGLSAPLARKLTFELPILRIILQQTVRRFPLFNLRPLLGITRKRSTKAMGYFAQGYLRLYQLTGQQAYLDKARYCLADLRENYSQGYHGHAWGNAFDYQSRGDFIAMGVPTAVWTSFIGWAFVDAYELLGERPYLDVARSACEFTLRDLTRTAAADNTFCLSYIPNEPADIHNASMLAASLLARVYKHTREPELLEVAQGAVRYSMNRQRPDGSWYYGEGWRWRWVDGYHTGFVLDALYYYMLGSGDEQYADRLTRGMDYYRQRLFEGVMPKHYSNATYPIDIQPVAQAIQTFALIPEAYHGDLGWSEKVALWAVANMQDPSGYFYFRKYPHVMNKTACLHWGQSTTLAALALLLLRSKPASAQGTPSAA